MFDWGLGFLGDLVGFASDPAGTLAGWTFDKVTKGLFEWMARGLALLLEWVWGVLDTGTTPRVTEDWFANELAGRVVALALAVTVAMMLASAIQAALAGRPEQAFDAVKESARAIVASALTITVIDQMIGVVDAASEAVWETGRDDLVTMIESIVEVTVHSELLSATFVGALCLLFGFIGLLGLTVSLLMRSALIYLVAALAPLVFSASVLPVMRDSSRRMVHLMVALVVSKLAIVVCLVVAVKLAGNAGATDSGAAVNDAAAAVGTLITGFACFLVAAVSPFVLYRLMPTAEGAVAASGVVGGWGRSVMSLGQAALVARGIGAGAGSTSVAGQGGVAGSAGSMGSAGAAGAAAGPAGAAAGPALGAAAGAAGAGASGVTGLAAATQAGSGSGAGASGGAAGAGGSGGGSTQQGPQDGNLPPLPPTPDGPEPAPWAPPGSGGDNDGREAPRYPTRSPGNDEDHDDGNLPALPPPPRLPSPWVAPDAASDGGSAGDTPSPGAGAGAARAASRSGAGTGSRSSPRGGPELRRPATLQPAPPSGGDQRGWGSGGPGRRGTGGHGGGSR